MYARNVTATTARRKGCRFKIAGNGEASPSLLAATMPGQLQSLSQMQPRPVQQLLRPRHASRQAAHASVFPPPAPQTVVRTQMFVAVYVLSPIEYVQLWHERYTAPLAS